MLSDKLRAEVRAYMAKHSYMELDSDEPIGLAYGTRDNSDDNETPSSFDVQHARVTRLGLLAEFPVRVEIDHCDEWVNIRIVSKEAK